MGQGDEIEFRAAPLERNAPSDHFAQFFRGDELRDGQFADRND